MTMKKDADCDFDAIKCPHFIRHALINHWKSSDVAIFTDDDGDDTDDDGNYADDDDNDTDDDGDDTDDDDELRRW